MTADPSDDARREAPPHDEAPLTDEYLHEELAAVYHELNNSLSVISGNAQLLTEMARMEDLDASFSASLGDIDAAGAELADALTRLNQLRRRLGKAGAERPEQEEA